MSIYDELLTAALDCRKKQAALDKVDDYLVEHGITWINVMRDETTAANRVLDELLELMAKGADTPAHKGDDLAITEMRAARDAWRYYALSLLREKRELSSCSDCAIKQRAASLEDVNEHLRDEINSQKQMRRAGNYATTRYDGDPSYAINEHCKHGDDETPNPPSGGSNVEPAPPHKWNIARDKWRSCIDTHTTR